MFFLVYGSSEVRPFSKDELTRLLETCCENNARLGITGILLYKDGNFMQALEGEKEKVLALFETISGDPRHRGVLVLKQGEESERQFPDWSMAFRDLNSPEVQALPGFSEFLNTPLTDKEFSENPTRCQKLILTFKRTM